MDFNTVVVSVAGVAGTLGAALLTQRQVERAKRREIDLLRRLDDARDELTLRRTCYVEVNRDARMFNTALNHYLHVLRERPVTDDDRQTLDDAKAAHRDRHSQVQMIAPDQVLMLASAANQALNSLYGQVMRLERGEPGPEDTVESASQAQSEIWDRLREMRRAMRQDLGVQPPS
ncbi:hypothetical protein ACN6K6_004718 [Streptomyces violaceoruber]|uniref:hypothetical protein n=1 Tax=Streptomyces violaceoruber TaxID=1935 RepID=UPI00403C6CB2